MSNSTCFNCGTSEMESPLIPLKFQGKEVTICPQCLPTLIHKPDLLAGKLTEVALAESSQDKDHSSGK